MTNLPVFERNQGTQPTVLMPVFNNPYVVAEGWYYVCASTALKKSKAQGFQICGQELVLFRGEDGRVRALDAYCPHMGTHLGVGKVVGNEILCFFHHWRFNENGACTDIPCQKNIPERAQLRNYAVIEKYDSIWVHPKADISSPLADFPELGGEDLTVVKGKPYPRTCHHHVTMINGIDPQHLKTVHDLNIVMDLKINEQENGRQISIALSGDIPAASWAGRLTRFFLGPRYAYSMLYDHANNGLLTLMKDVRLFGRGPALPTLHILFAYRAVSSTQSLVQPLFITRKRKGLGGFLISRFLIFVTQRAFFSLQGEDGKVYENMRFFPKNLLAIDKPVAQYIQYVNKLPVSPWKVSNGARN